MSLSNNARLLAPFFTSGWFIPTDSVNFIAREMEWGWHRTNNALKELGLR